MDSKDYKQTLQLPSTDVPMRANLPEREPGMLSVWESEKLYERMLAYRDGAPRFLLHDGPPYANGAIHIGHALNKILKDVIVKYKTMAGFQSPYRPGWDTHGLPIELEVEKKVGRKAKAEMSLVEVRRLCREYADKFVGVQMQDFKRLGVFGEWDRIFKNPMTTAAAIDRLVHHSVILEFDGPSIRAEEARKRNPKKESAHPS